MYNFRTDLASERRDIYQKANNVEGQINGVESEQEEDVYKRQMLLMGEEQELF